jgi:sulfur carrier protein ThiS
MDKPDLLCDQPRKRQTEITLPPVVVRQLEALLNSVGPDDSVIISKRNGRIVEFIKQTNIRVQDNLSHS